MGYGSGFQPVGYGPPQWPWSHCKGPVNSVAYQTGQGQLVGCCECSNEPLRFIK